MNRLVVAACLLLCSLRLSADTGPRYALEFIQDYGNSGSWVNCGSGPSFNITAAITLEAWIRPGGRLDWDQIVGKQWAWDGNPWHVYSLRIAGWRGDQISNRKPQFLLAVNGAPCGVTATSPIQMDTWMHVAATYDGSVMRIYVNGVEEGTPLVVSGPISVNDRPVVLGRNIHQYYNGFSGRMDEVRVWNVARSGRQIKRYMNRRLAGNEEGLVGYWRFDEGTGGTTADATGHGNTGTIENAVWLTSDAPFDQIDLTTNNATGAGDMTQARYMVNLGISGGQSVMGDASPSGLYDCASLLGVSQNDFWVMNDGGSEHLLSTREYDGSLEVSPPDFFGYKFKYPAAIASVEYTSRCLADDGGSFNGAPELQYLDGDGVWQTVAATWDYPYDSSFSLGTNSYLILPDVPVPVAYGVRLCGDTTPAPTAFDTDGWAGVVELKVNGVPDFGRPVDFSDNLALTGAAVCSGNAWKDGSGAPVNNGDFRNSCQVWDTADPAGEKYVGLTWASPQSNVSAVGIALSFGPPLGGWFIDTPEHPLKVQYTTDGATWNDAANLNKGRYTVDYPSAVIVGMDHLYVASWLFTFDRLPSITGIRLIGVPGGSDDQLAGHGFLAVNELEIFRALPEPGDIQADSRINVLDVYAGLRMLLGLPVRVDGQLYEPPYTEYLLFEADANEDGANDVDDIIFLLRQSLGWTT